MTDLFTSTTTETPNTNENPLEALVGEGKKFKTNEELAKAKMESDRFIQQLQGELQGIRQELSTRQTLEQLMDKMAAKESTNTNQEHNQNSQGGDGNVKSFTEEDIARLVEERLSKSEQARIHQTNLASVQKALVESIGPDYVTHLKAKAQELGVSEEYLNNMAKETPKAFLKLVEANGEARATTPGLFSPPPSHNLPSQSNKGFAPTGQRKMSWYEDLKKKDPSGYWSPTIQNQMHKDALSLGEAFFDA